MSRLSPRALLSLVLIPAAVAVAGCGSGVGPASGGVQVAKSDPLYEGGVIFNQRCSGCHTFDKAGAEGSATKPNSREYKDGPNFNVRKEEYGDVIYAIVNGGFSSGPMPQNIVTGRQARLVACFVATYSGKQAARLPTPGKQPVEGSGDDDCQQELQSTR